jgi:hypothetical protein
MAHIHTNTGDCNSNPQDVGAESTVYPIASADVLAAAIDGSCSSLSRSSLPALSRKPTLRNASFPQPMSS